MWNCTFINKICYWLGVIDVVVFFEPLCCPEWLWICKCWPLVYIMPRIWADCFLPKEPCMLWLDICICYEFEMCCYCVFWELFLSRMLAPLGPAAEIARFCGLFIWPPVDWALLNELVSVFKWSVLRDGLRSPSGTVGAVWLALPEAFEPDPPG